MASHVDVIALGNPLARCFALRGNGVVLVDASLPGTAPQILRGLARHGIRPREINLILITHAHTDHYGALAAVREAAGAPVAVHAADAAALESGAGCQMQAMTSSGRRLLRRINSAPPDPDPARKPDFTVDDGFELEPYGVAGRVLHLPGHTPGHLGVWLDEGEALIGDLLMRRYFICGGPWLPFIANDPAGWRASLARLAALHPRRCYGSHMSPAGPAQVEHVLVCADRTAH